MPRRFFAGRLLVMGVAALLGAAGGAGCAPGEDPVRCGSAGEVLYPSALATIEGCTEFLGSIHISDTGLTDLEALSGLRSVDGFLHLFRNEELTSLRGLERLESAGQLSIHFHGALESVEALARLRDVRDDLQVSNNRALDTLRGLEKVRSVGLLRVIGNDRLARLDGLAGLETVIGDLEITYNPSLPQADAEAFAAALDVGGTIDVSDNMP